MVAIITLLFSLNFYCSTVLLSQVEYRAGLGLYEVTEVFTGLGYGHTHPFYKNHQAVNSCFVESENNRVTHRLTARYINLPHSLVNRGYELNSEWTEYGEYKLVSRSFGYNFLYNFGKQKRFSTGIGLSYNQGKVRSQILKEHYVDLVNKAVIPNLLFEGNIKVCGDWYIIPALQIRTEFNFSSINNAPPSIHTWHQYPSWRLEYPIRISLKKTITTKK